MLKIGDFSKLSRVSVKTLRFYDALGLLRPVVVDENNGYRYYSEEQLLTVKRIAAFKDQGFTLEQIIPFIGENISLEAVKNKLADKQTELHRTIEEAKNQLNEIQGRLQRVEESNAFYAAAHSVTIRSVDSQLAASLRSLVPLAQLCLLLDEATQYVRSYGEDHGSSLIILRHDQDTETNLADIEVALPIPNPIPGSNRVKVGYLPGIKTAASLVHHCDPYSTSCSASAELEAWISFNGYARDNNAPIRETYLTSDKDMYGKMRLAELLIPVELVK